MDSDTFGMHFGVGDLVDGFLLEERLHQGGMASLWRVTHPDHRLPMLMKVPRIQGGEDPATIVGFEVEMMILPMLRGVHVPRFIAKGDFATRPYIVMEHIAGDSLRPKLDAAPLPVDEIASIGARVAAGCTSGLGLSGAATLGIAAFVFLGTFFITGLIVHRLVRGV